MVNHWFDEEPPRTRCGEYEGEYAWHVSSNDRVSCPECRELLTEDERSGQWYSYATDKAPVAEATVTESIEDYDVLHRPPEPHIHKAPIPDRDTKGWIVLCRPCGMVLKCVPGDYGWYWRPVSIWSERRWKKKAGIK